jgi:hypothetical protein
MKSKLVAALSLALVAAVLMTTAVAAEQGGGSGMLTAQGDGVAGMRGNGSVTISGAGTLYIRDLAGDASINVTGKGVKRELRNGWVAYAGFNGQARVSGSKITVVLSGVNIHLQATGSGMFMLRGRGTYHTDKGNGVWTDEGKVLSLP